MNHRAREKVTTAVPEMLLLIFQVMIFSLLMVKAVTEGFEARRNEIILFGCLLLGIFISHRLIRRFSVGDEYLFLIAEFLISLGVMMIYRLDHSAGMKQGVWIGLSLLMYFVGYAFLRGTGGIFRKLFYPALAVSYLLFFSTFAFGSRVKGAVNWIQLGKFTFQPAELTKVLLIFLLASYYSYPKRAHLENYPNYNGIWDRYGGFIISGIVYSFIGLLFLQRDLGMSVIFFLILFVTQFVFEKDRRVLWMNAGIAVLGALGGYFLFHHVQVRVDAWLAPLKYVEGKGYQITQSLIAISEGSFFGTGVGLGYPGYIPAAKTDFVFSAICEEMGLFTGVAVILLYLLLVYRGIKISLSVHSSFARILSLGVSISFGFQALIILGGVTKMIPMTGITLPFVSYGGSSMLMSMMLMLVLQYASEEGWGSVDES